MILRVGKGNEKFRLDAEVGAIAELSPTKHAIRLKCTYLTTDFRLTSKENADHSEEVSVDILVLNAAKRTQMRNSKTYCFDRNLKLFAAI